MRRRRVAIIGAGFSGVALAAQLASARRAPNVVLIERGRFGPGLAYATKDPDHMLNVRASQMSACPDRPDHFRKWLRAHRAHESPDPFVPRRTYGAYLEWVLSRAQLRRPFGGLKRVRDEAVSCRREGEGWRVDLLSGRSLNVDTAVIAVGYSEPSVPDALARAHATIIDAWDGDTLRRISPKADVLLLGTGLTMVDVALTLSRSNRVGVINALSCTGLLPRPQPKSIPNAPVDEIPLPQRLSEALHTFRAEVRRMAGRGEPWQFAFDRIRCQTASYWRRLPLDAQRRFLRHLRPWWNVHRHRAPPEVLDRINALMAQNRLRVFAGEIVSATGAADRVQVTYRQRNGFARHRLEVSHVVNCLPRNNQAANSADPLLRQMLVEGVVRQHATGLGLDADESGRLFDAHGEAHTDLYALGPVVLGGFWESIGVAEIREHAAALAKLIAVR